MTADVSSGSQAVVHLNKQQPPQLLILAANPVLSRARVAGAKPRSARRYSKRARLVALPIRPKPRRDRAINMRINSGHRECQSEQLQKPLGHRSFGIALDGTIARQTDRTRVPLSVSPAPPPAAPPR